MPPSLTTGPQSFTIDEVIDILDRNSPYFPPDTDRFPAEFDPIVLRQGRQRTRVSISLDSARLASETQQLCGSILGHNYAIEGAIERLDVAFSSLLVTNFRFRHPSDILAQTACDLLCRMPRTVAPLILDEAPNICEYFPDEAFVSLQPRTWENLNVTRFVDSNTIRLALDIAGGTTSRYMAFPYQKLADLCGDIFTELVSMSAWPALQHGQTIDGEAQVFLQFARVFFWSAWNRCIMLNVWYVLECHLAIGYDHTRNGSLVFRHESLLRTLMTRGSNTETSHLGRSYGIRNTEYMCRWALRLLQSDLGSIGQDFRHFHERYHLVFGQRHPRCNLRLEEVETFAQCSGDSPSSCNRFQGMKIEDQSAHATNCGGACEKLVWCEMSYRSVDGPRAVDTIATITDQIKYRTATQRTMAISHVWSHGQGGRPESPRIVGTHATNTLPVGTGFNVCLHKRYSSIAADMHCDSYWMDTPCIPQDHRLRRESIGHINEIFANALVVLVCDRDLMDIDITPRHQVAGRIGATLVSAESIPMEVLESILATIMVCDWNLRAWTFLESMRGRRNLHLLCKNEMVIRLYDIVCRVHRHGRMDISVLLVNAQHILPAQLPKIDSSGVVEKWHRDRAKGLVDVVDATFLLSHRHASREGDEVVIWSLLCRETPCYNAVEFWSVFQNEEPPALLPASYLMNNLPRIKESLSCSQPRLGWAPSRPNFPAAWDDSASKRYFMVPTSNQCRDGRVSKEGFIATWLVSELKCQWPWSWLGMSSKQVTTKGEPFTSIARCLRFNVRGALIQPCDILYDEPVTYRGSTEGDLFGIVGQDLRGQWHWKGVINWPSGQELPPFVREEITIV